MVRWVSELVVKFAEWKKKPLKQLSLFGSLRLQAFNHVAADKKEEIG